MNKVKIIVTLILALLIVFFRSARSAALSWDGGWEELRELAAKRSSYSRSLPQSSWIKACASLRSRTCGGSAVKAFFFFMAARLPEKRDQTSDLGDRGMLITFFFVNRGLVNGYYLATSE